MPKRAKIDFIASDTPITEPVTKFGGQPVWLTAPQWPLSRRWPDAAGKMAYLFMTDDEDCDTWQAEGGENALIIQPSSAELPVSTVPNAIGSPLCRFEEHGKTRRANPCEYRAALTLGEEPEWLDEDSLDSLYEDERLGDEALEQYLEQYSDALEGNKLGGGPLFIQNDEFPEGDGWRLLLQLDSTQVPFELDFGDAGVGYAFIDAAGERGRFLWQCC